MKKEKVKNAHSNAGRKKVLDKKIPVTLLVEKSKIVGEENLDMDITSHEFREKVAEMKTELYKTIDFTRGK